MTGPSRPSASAARGDRRRVVLPGQSERHRHPPYPQAVAATLIDGKALAEKVRAEVAREVEELGARRARDRPRRRRPRVAHLHRPKHKAAQAGRHRGARPAAPRRHRGGGASAHVEELNADDSVDGLLVQLPLPGPPRREPDHRGDRPGKDIDGIHPFNAGLLYLGRPTLVPGDAARGHAHARRVRRSRSRARAPSSSAAARSSASRWPSSCSSERDGDGLPLPHAGPRSGTRSTRTSSSPPSAAPTSSAPTW